MARKVRVEFPGAIYHVMARGNERAKIFHKTEDYELFLSTLGAGLEQFKVKLRAYCLMPNHFHLVLETPEGNLTRFMAWFQTTFTVRYNRKHRRSGHLFQGRYRAEIVDSASYGKWLLLYVHLNPIRTRKSGTIHYHAGVEALDRFAWSSHRTYLGLSVGLKGLDVSWLAEWGKTPLLARQGYKRTIRSELRSADPLDWKNNLTLGLVAGNEELLNKVKKLLSGKGKESGAKQVQSVDKQRRLQKLQSVLEKEADLRIAVWMRVRLLGERPVDLARERGYRDGGSILQIVKRTEARAVKDQNLLRKMNLARNMSRVDD